MGFPAARLYGGISLVTTLPAPITHPSPMVTPPQTTTLDASQQLSFYSNWFRLFKIIKASIFSFSAITFFR